MQHQGKELSYNNINDTDAAVELVAEFDPKNGPACVIVKHAYPCGVSQGASLVGAYQAAFQCDQTSAFGGIIALNRTLDGPTASDICKIFTEVVIAPDAAISTRSQCLTAAAEGAKLSRIMYIGLPCGWPDGWPIHSQGLLQDLLFPKEHFSATLTSS